MNVKCSEIVENHKKMIYNDFSFGIKSLQNFFLSIKKFPETIYIFKEIDQKYVS